MIACKMANAFCVPGKIFFAKNLKYYIFDIKLISNTIFKSYGKDH